MVRPASMRAWTWRGKWTRKPRPTRPSRPILASPRWPVVTSRATEAKAGGAQEHGERHGGADGRAHGTVFLTHAGVADHRSCAPPPWSTKAWSHQRRHSSKRMITVSAWNCERGTRIFSGRATV